MKHGCGSIVPALFLTFLAAGCYEKGKDAGKSVGDRCEKGSECESGICFSLEGGDICSRECAADGDCPLQYACEPYEQFGNYCLPESVGPCKPACDGKQCGPDGCGEECGLCGAGETCNTVTGLCAEQCEPACDQNQCGPDGCGAECGLCGAGETCNNVTGFCAEQCEPACAGKQCGPDGCGEECGRCDADETCDNGECKAIPQSCPAEGCPFGTYCDLVLDRCVTGCLEDSGCAPNEICVNRTCAIGCRTDAACGNRKICENEQCITGCRDDSFCDRGSICDGILCRPGCRNEPDCPSGKYCDVGTLRCLSDCPGNASCSRGYWCDGSAGDCAECPDLANDPGNTQDDAAMLTLTQGEAEASREFAVCGYNDEDYLIVSLVYTQDEYTAIGSIEVTGAPSGTVTTIKHWDEDWYWDVYTKTIEGEGSIEVINRSGSCTGVCETDNVVLVLSTDTSDPVEYKFNGHIE